MPSDRFALLQAEFRTVLDRLKQSKDAAEKQTLLKEMRQIVLEMERVVEEYRPKD
jgi:soluble cytochrome b562